MGDDVAKPNIARIKAGGCCNDIHGLAAVANGYGRRSVRRLGMEELGHMVETWNQNATRKVFFVSGIHRLLLKRCT